MIRNARLAKVNVEKLRTGEAQSTTEVKEGGERGTDNQRPGPSGLQGVKESGTGTSMAAPKTVTKEPARHGQGTTPWTTTQSKPSKGKKKILMQGGQLDTNNERWRTVFFIRGSRARRLATHARKVYHLTIHTNSPKAYKVAELGEIGLKPDRETAKHWLAVLEGADLQKGDIVVLLPFDSIVWQDAREDLLVPTEEPHLKAPDTPMEENTQLQDALTATI